MSSDSWLDCKQVFLEKKVEFFVLETFALHSRSHSSGRTSTASWFLRIVHKFVIDSVSVSGKNAKEARELYSHINNYIHGGIKPLYVLTIIDSKGERER